MVNTQLSSELRRPAQFAGAAAEISHAMQRYGDISPISLHHEFNIEVPDTVAPHHIPSLDISIVDDHKPDATVHSFFTIEALGHPAESINNDNLTTNAYKIQRTPEGATVYIPILGNLLVELLQKDTTANTVAYALKNYLGASEAGLEQDPNNNDLVKNPLYRLLLSSCYAPESAPVTQAVRELRRHSIGEGYSTARQSGRLDVRGRYYITYDAERILQDQEAPSGHPDILEETYATTTIRRDAKNNTRIDTKLVVSSLLNPYELGISGVNVEELQLISAERTLLEIGSEHPAVTETSTTMLDSLGIIGPLLVAARAAANNRHIRYDRRKAA